MAIHELMLAVRRSPSGDARHRAHAVDARAFRHPVVGTIDVSGHISEADAGSLRGTIWDVIDAGCDKILVRFDDIRCSAVVLTELLQWMLDRLTSGSEIRILTSDPDIHELIACLDGAGALLLPFGSRDVPLGRLVIDTDAHPAGG